MLEFGGWRGHLAASALIRDRRIYEWVNFEISSLAKDHQVRDNRYRVLVPNSFCWETPCAEGSNFFVTSHSVEHLSGKHTRLLFSWLPKSIEWMFLQIPLNESDSDRKWDGFGGTHINELGWTQIFELIPDFRLIWAGGKQNEVRLLRRKI